MGADPQILMVETYSFLGRKPTAETARGMACGLPLQNWPFRSSVSCDTVSEPSDSWTPSGSRP